MPFEEGVDVLIAKQMPKDILWQEMQEEKKQQKQQQQKQNNKTNHKPLFHVLHASNLHGFI